MPLQLWLACPLQPPPVPQGRCALGFRVYVLCCLHQPVAAAASCCSCSRRLCPSGGTAPSLYLSPVAPAAVACAPAQAKNSTPVHLLPVSGRCCCRKLLALQPPVPQRRHCTVAVFEPNGPNVNGGVHDCIRVWYNGHSLHPYPIVVLDGYAHRASWAAQNLHITRRDKESR